jgi:hypothetical protein
VSERDLVFINESNYSHLVSVLLPVRLYSVCSKLLDPAVTKEYLSVTIRIRIRLELG